MAKKEEGRKVVAQNRKALHEYFIDERYEAGIILSGTEVKSLREGRATIGDAHAAEMQGDLWLFNAYIPEFHAGNQFNHETRRPRKLLMRRRQIETLKGAVQRKGLTVVPLAIYFTDRGWAKVELGLARGKKMVDKRQSEKDRDWQRDKQRLLRETHKARE